VNTIKFLSRKPKAIQPLDRQILRSELELTTKDLDQIRADIKRINGGRTDNAKP
jgi:hypothetical protein